jgi:type I restriction enzyme S subunit
MYQKYKPITLPWLSQIPKHWELVRNKILLHEAKDTVGFEHAKYQLLSLTKGGVIIRDISSGKGKFPSDFGTYKIVSNGQIIFCLFDVDETPRAIGLSKYSGMITGAYNVFSIEGVNPQYMEYYYISLDDVKAMRPLYTGLRKVIGINAFMQTCFPLPPRNEQDQIVRFLNWKVSQINKLINAKRRQVELLREKRRMVIDEVVNRQQEQIKLKYLIKIKSGDALTNIFLVDDENSCPVFGGGKLIGYYHKSNVNEKNILLGRVGANCGCVTRLRGEAWATDNALIVTANCDLDYLEYLLLSANLNSMNESNARPLITGHKVLNFTTKYSTDINEQHAIVAYLDKQCKSLDKFADKLNDEIALFIEYRTCLISDIVTGKIDVRGVVVPEYEDMVEDVVNNEETNDDMEVIQ